MQNSKNCFHNVNWVFSGNVNSKIFKDISKRFYYGLDDKYILKLSKNIVHDQHIYHFHRLNKQTVIPKATCVATIHHDFEDDSLIRFDNCYLNNLSRMEKLICISERQADFLKKKGICESKVVVIPHGYDESILSRTKSKEIYQSVKRKKFIGFFSKRYANKLKGENLLIEIAKKLNPKLFSFLLVGEGRFVEKRKLMRLGFDVFCFDSMRYCEFINLYKVVDYLLITSRYEGGPASVPEALASGSKIISREVGVVEYYNRLNNNVITYKTVDEAVSALNEDFIVNFDIDCINPWSEVIRLYMSVYEDLL